MIKLYVTKLMRILLSIACVMLITALAGCAENSHDNTATVEISASPTADIAFAQETGASDETVSVTDNPKEEEFLVVSDLDSKEGGSGFSIDFQIKRWPRDTFVGKVGEISDILRKQYEDYDPVSSKKPGSWVKTFDMSAEIQDYLGCDMLIIPTWDLEETMSSLTVYGDEEGNIEKLCVETDYKTDNIRMQLFSYIFTEFDDDKSFGYLVGQNYVQEEGLTPGGFQYNVVTENSHEYICKEGFLIKNGVLYNFHLAYTAAYEQEAKERLEQWLAYF